MKLCRLFSIAIIAFTCFFAASCEEENTDSGFTGMKEQFDGCVAIYKGESTALGQKLGDLTLYKTNVEDEYFIPYFFYGAYGELDFFWDQKTNILRVENTFSGLYNDIYPVNVLDQKEYEKTYGEAGQKSYFDPATKTFSFTVLMETAIGDNDVIRTTEVLEFKITEVLKQL